MILAAGCASTSAGPEIAEEIGMEPVHVEADPLGEIPARFWDSYILFEKATKHFEKENYGESAELYRHVIEGFPDSELAAPATFNLALCMEGMGRFAEAADTYESLLASYPGALETAEVLFRLGGCREKTGEWEEVARIFGVAVHSFPLTAVESITAEAREGVSRYMLGQRDQALKALRAALKEYEELRARRILLPSYQVARAYFYLGEIYLDRFREVSLDAEEGVLEIILEGKARLLLLARAQYIKVVRLYVPTWTTASLYRIGEGYEEFYRSVLRAPDPPDLGGDELERYRRELEDRLYPVLAKAIDVHRRNVQTAAEMNVNNEWVEASRLKLVELEAE